MGTHSRGRALPARHKSPAPREVRKCLPAVVSCPGLEELQTLSPEEARRHVDAYLHEVMPRQDADDFEALSFRWELHLVPLDHLRLLRTVDLSPRKLRRYRSVIRRGGVFPPLVGLGGDGRRITENVFLCDGYHRVTAMRDVGVHFAWIWLASDRWESSMAQASSTTLPATRAQECQDNPPEVEADASLSSLQQALAL
jgi:hypothetical protein